MVATEKGIPGNENTARLLKKSEERDTVCL